MPTEKGGTVQAQARGLEIASSLTHRYVTLTLRNTRDFDKAVVESPRHCDKKRKAEECDEGLPDLHHVRADEQQDDDEPDIREDGEEGRAIVNFELIYLPTQAPKNGRA